MDRNSDFQVPPCMYDRFDMIRKLQTMIEKPVANGHATYDGCISYEKMIRTGNLECHDYGCGFLNFSIMPYFDSKNWVVRIYFSTLDDGGMGGWSQVMTKKDAIDISKEIAHVVFNDMDALPTLEELNIILRPYKVYCCQD